MLKLIKNPASIEFLKPLERDGHHVSHGKHHEEIAKEYLKTAIGFASIIIIDEPLDDDLYEDPKYMHQDYAVGVSDVISEARRLLRNNHPMVEDIHEQLEKMGFPKKPNNYESTKEEDYKFMCELEDAMYAALEYQMVPEIVQRMKEEFKYDYGADYDDTEEPPKKSAARFKKEWAKESLKIHQPRIVTRYSRVYSMPEPFCYWDYRNSFQQWFFIENKTGITYISGGSGSSGQREDMGRFAHAFAHLSRHNDVKIPTHCFKYDKRNNFLHLESFKTFKAVNRELTGNYHVEDREESTKLFKDMLLFISSKEDDSKILEKITREDYWV